MKLFKSIVVIALLSITTAQLRAQDYCTLKYWGKEYKLDRQFISVLNDNWTSFMGGQAEQLKYYDGKDYQDIYTVLVGNLTNSSFTIIVTEANQLRWENPNGVLPGTDGEKGRSKKSFIRATTVWYRVILPALTQFVQYKDYQTK